MANVTDFANAAAAVTAGYQQFDSPNGAGGFTTKFVKALRTTDGPPYNMEAVGESTVDQATATAKALASLNAQRRHYYGGSPGRASGQPQSDTAKGGVHTIDAT
jgi:hypothetical protein